MTSNVSAAVRHAAQGDPASGPYAPKETADGGPLLPRVRAMAPEDIDYIRGAWSEGYKGSSNRMHKMTWGRFKAEVRPVLHQILARSEVLVAEHDGHVVGWIALARGARVDTVHWIATRLCVNGGPLLRRRGVMLAVIDAARLKDRIVYTHRGTKRSDEWIARWLRTRGAISVVFQPYEEWK